MTRRKKPVVTPPATGGRSLWCRRRDDAKRRLAHKKNPGLAEEGCRSTAKAAKNKGQHIIYFYTFFASFNRLISLLLQKHMNLAMDSYYD